MTWTLYRWVWRLESPLYIGAPPAGSLSRTRLYVPTRALWGALTAELARSESALGGSPSYAEVGEAVRNHTRLTYLYPADKFEGEWRTWLPEYRDGEGLVSVPEHGGRVVPDRRFRGRLLHTRPGTAIEPYSDASLDTSLRETECMQSSWIPEDGAAVSRIAMVGYVLASDEIKARLDAVETLFLGGDTRYGLGKTILAKCAPAERIFGHRMVCETGTLKITAARVLGHSTGCDNMTGALELTSGWDIDALKASTSSEPLWAPGSKCASEQLWSIEHDGTWIRKAAVGV